MLNRRFLIAMAAIFLCSCASDLPSYATANAEFEIYEKAELQFKLNLPGIPDNTETEGDKTKIAKIWRDKVSLCARDFLQSITDGKFESVSAIKDEHSKFSLCASQHGLIGTAYAVIAQEREIEFPAYVDEFLAVATKLAKESFVNQAYATSQRHNFWTAFAVSMSSRNALANPSIQSVSPYVRQNGTFVAPHIRTSPNQYCFDNLRGCR